MARGNKQVLSALAGLPDARSPRWQALPCGRRWSIDFGLICFEIATTAHGFFSLHAEFRLSEECEFLGTYKTAAEAKKKANTAARHYGWSRWKMADKKTNTF